MITGNASNKTAGTPSNKSMHSGITQGSSSNRNFAGKRKKKQREASPLQTSNALGMTTSISNQLCKNISAPSQPSQKIRAPEFYLSSSDFSSDSEEDDEVNLASDSEEKELSVDSLNFVNHELMPTSLQFADKQANIILEESGDGFISQYIGGGVYSNRP